MRRMVSFLLILAFCLTMACPAFAATDSPGENGPVKYPTFWGDNPKTGDVIMFWALMLVVSMVALGVVYVTYRKKFCK